MENNDDVLEALRLQFSFLNDRLRVYEEVIQTDDIYIKDEISTRNFDTKTCSCDTRFKYELEEKNRVIACLKDELVEKDNELKSILKEKDSQIDNLKRQLEMIKLERTAEKIRPQHSHTDSISTMASYTIINNDETERQLVEMKFKYAEICGRLTDLESELEKRNNQVGRLMGIIQRDEGLKVDDCAFLECSKLDDFEIIDGYIDNVCEAIVAARNVNDSGLNNTSFIDKVKKFIKF
jgi:hypothetical protein